MKRRKIIQVTVEALDRASTLIALCDDGTIWWLPYYRLDERDKHDWLRLPQIPGDVNDD